MVTGPSFSSRISVFPGAGVPAALVIGKRPCWKCGSGGGDAGADQLIRVGHRAVARLVTKLDLIDSVHAGDDAAPDSVLPVEAGIWCEHDEELAVRAIVVWTPCHAAGSTDELILLRELRLQVG